MQLRDGRQVLRIAEMDLELVALGAGPPLLYLHANEGPLALDGAFLRELATRHRVIAPWHPGFGRLERPKDLREVGELAYLYLELVDTLMPEPPRLVGASFGGWIAAEMAVRSPASFAELVLIAPLGIKIGDRETRDIADVFAMTPDEEAARSFALPARGKLDLDAFSDDDLAAHFRARESWAYFGWKPFMHNPRLKRWLCRIRNRALVIAGARDRIVREGYHAAFAEALPNGQIRTIDDAGHYPHIEQPEAVATAIADFCRIAAAPDARPLAASAPG